MFGYIAHRPGSLGGCLAYPFVKSTGLVSAPARTSPSTSPWSVSTRCNEALAELPDLIAPDPSGTMTFSSPPKRRPVHSRTSSPDPGLLLLDHLGPQDRNTESSHNVALQGKAEHHREVQEAAIAVLNDQRAQLEISKKEQLILQMRLRAQQEEHRLRIEQAAAAEQARLNALKAASIKKPPPLPPSPAARTTPPPQPRQDAAVREVISTETQTSPGITSHPIGATNGFSQPQGQPPAQSTTASRIPPAPQVQPAAQASRSEPPQPPTNSAPTQSPFDKPPAFKPIPPSQPAAAKQATPAADEVDLRYLQIHKSLKKLRMWMVQQASGSPAMKNQLGDMRREIRKCVGQLVPGSNAQQVCNTRWRERRSCRVQDLAS